MFHQYQQCRNHHDEMKEKCKWVMSILSFPSILLFLIIIYQLEYNSTGHVSVRSSLFEGEEALFVLAILKIFLAIISFHAIVTIYKRYTNKEFDREYSEKLLKNDTHVCLECKEAFVPGNKGKCVNCGSSSIEPVKGIYSKYPSLDSNADLTAENPEHNRSKSKPLSKKDKAFNKLTIGWSILWLGGLTFKITIDHDFIAVIIFIWPFLVIAYLIPYIIKILKYNNNITNRFT